MLYLAAALFCVFANAFFVAAEFALAKVRPSSLEALAKNGDASARRAFGLTQKLDAYLSATQLGITLASLGLGWVGEPALAGLLTGPLHRLGIADPAVVHGVALTIAFSIISLLHIVIGELVPKSLAIQQPVGVARVTARALKGFYLLTWPFLWLLNGSSQFVLRLLRLPAPDHAEGSLSLDELRILIAASTRGGSLDEHQRELIERVLRSTDRPVRAIMVPRVDLAMLSLKDNLETSLALVRKNGYSRFPLSEDGEADRIIGYLYVKDLILAEPRQGLRHLRRDILYVPEAMSVGDLLHRFQRSKIPIAVVVDEYGGTSGLVTLEDAIEEIVGEIQDELDIESPRVSAREDGSILVDGSLPVGEIQLDGLVLPEIEGGDTTMGGLILSSLGRLARPGDVVRLGSYDAIVDDVRQRRVTRVALQPRTPTLPPRDAPSDDNDESEV